MTYFVNPSERKKIPPMITHLNQVRLAKMAGRRVQEARVKKRGRIAPTTLQPKAALDIAHYGWK
jgi:hypothetical protein